MSKKTGPFEMVAIDTQEQESGQVLHVDNRSENNGRFTSNFVEPYRSLNTTGDNYNTL